MGCPLAHSIPHSDGVALHNKKMDCNVVAKQKAATIGEHNVIWEVVMFY
jgi:hypothetical protein